MADQVRHYGFREAAQAVAEAKLIRRCAIGGRQAHARSPGSGEKATTALLANIDTPPPNVTADKRSGIGVWKNIKTHLTGAYGAGYFSSSMKTALLPTLKGKVVKLEPETKPKTVVMALEDGTHRTQR